jgi:predicted amidophosphoribosyltransferase
MAESDAHMQPPYSRQQLGRHQFNQTESGDWLLSLRPYYAWLFSARYPDIIASSRTGWRDSQWGSNKYAYFARLSPEHIAQIQDFITMYQRMVVVGINRHLASNFAAELDACVCLDFNKAEQESGSMPRTEIGELEYLAKYQHDHAAIGKLVNVMGNALNWIPISCSLDRTIQRCVTYVPPEPDKEYHLPREIARQLTQPNASTLSGAPFGSLVDATLAGAKASLKNATLDEKRTEWQRLTTPGAITLSRPVSGCAVYVVDDLYQSGTTIWTYARYLKSAGARWVFGIVCVKSLRDTDNT